MKSKNPWLKALAFAVIGVIFAAAAAILLNEAIPYRKIGADIKNNGGTFFNPDLYKEYAEEKTFPAQGVAEIQAEFAFDVAVKETEGDQVTVAYRVLEYSLGKDDLADSMRISLEGDRLEIEYESHVGVCFYSSGRLEIGVPAGYAGKIEIESHSGKTDVDLPTVRLESFKMEQTSGEALLKLTAAAIEIESTSGYVKGDVVTDDLKIELTSGKANVTGDIGNISAKLTSGNLTLSPHYLRGNVDAGLTSGTFRLVLPNVFGANVACRISSGKFRSDFSEFPSTDESFFTDKKYMEYQMNFRLTSGTVYLVQPA